MLEELPKIFIQSIRITGFVLIMIMLLEYITIQSKRQLTLQLQKNPIKQILLAGGLGLLPGCMGTFAVVSMYVHRSIGFPALVTALIATSGDEAFLMLSVIPQQGILLMLFITAIAITVGIALNFMMKNQFPIKPKHDVFDYAKEAKCATSTKLKVKLFSREYLSKERVIFIIGLLFFAFIILFGSGHEHHFGASEHEHSHFSWETFYGLIILAIGFVIVLLSPNDFVKRHLWGHVVKKHFARIFGWTFVAFSGLHFIDGFLDLRVWLANNVYYVMLVALLLGIIPESGPHIIFISLFVGGVLPISVLVANSIVQDGHGSIPLLAESGRGFLYAKLINFLVGGLVGYGLLFMGF